MKITKKHNDSLTNFYELDPSDIFLLKNAYYLKIDTIESEDVGIVNAVRIDTGEIYWFANNARVKKIEAELIVEV